MTIQSYVGSNTTIKGSLECPEDFLIEGSVEGNLRSNGTVVVGKDAVVRGDIVAREVAISGNLTGTIRCSERLEIFNSAKIVGTVQAPIVKMEPGARLNARIIMSQSPAEQQPISHSSEDSPPPLIIAQN
ncbi:MAG: polymer-forming cytoskeletal protein [Deltaproteobacteria bacterium]|nr:MAG: polymer-forming cytoskeletal protein [Deltaproteobacteria bacterium]